MSDAPRILVIGDLIRDVDVYGVCARFAQEAGGCPVFAEVRRTERPGGAGAVAAMCQGLGSHVGIETGPNESVKYRHFVEDRQVWRHDVDAAPLTAEEVAAIADRIAIATGHRGDWHAVLIADYGKGACQYAVVRAAIEGAAAAGIPCLVDPAHGVDWRTYRGATAIKCNALEFAASGSTISGRGWANHVEHCIVTHGESGLYHHGNDWPDTHYPARPSRLVDVTGCGDMVLAALGVALATGADWPDACRFATAAAGLKAERRGAVAVPRAEAVDAIVRSHTPMW